MWDFENSEGWLCVIDLIFVLGVSVGIVFSMVLS